MTSVLQLFSEHFIIGSELESNPNLKKYLAQAYNDKREEIKKEAELPPPKMDLSEYVVVSNLPVIQKEKEEKFFEVFVTIAKKLSLPFTRKDIIMPYKPDGKETHGCLFIKCADVKMADGIATRLNNVKFGKNVLKTVIMADFDRTFTSPPMEQHSFSKV